MSKKSKNPLLRLRQEASCSSKTPCGTHSCLDCATRSGNKYWDRIAQMKGPGDNNKLTAIQFCSSGKELYDGDQVNADLIRAAKDEVTRIAQSSEIKESRWLGLIYVLPVGADQRNQCHIVGTLHVAAATRRELSGLKKSFAQSKIVDMAWIDDVDDWEISDRRGFIAASMDIYGDPLWVSLLKSISQADCLITNSVNRLADFQVAGRK